MTTHNTSSTERSDITTIASRIKLATLNAGAWRATRLHKGETREENDRHNTTAAKVLVRVSDHIALSQIAKLHAAAYTEHRAMTMPSCADGFRLVPAAREMKHSARMAEMGKQHVALVSTFLADYDSEKAAAPSRLNGLYDASAWPSHSVIAEKFHFDVRYLPCPTDGAWSEWLNESLSAAQSDLRERVTDALRRVVDRCNSDGPLYASVFTSLADLIDVSGDFNVCNDATIDNAVNAARNSLFAYDVETLRDDTEKRREVAKQASSILDSFAAGSLS